MTLKKCKAPFLPRARPAWDLLAQFVGVTVRRPRAGRDTGLLKPWTCQKPYFGSHRASDLDWKNTQNT